MEDKPKVLSPKDVYFDKLSEMKDIDQIKGMTELYEWGSGDFKLN